MAGTFIFKDFLNGAITKTVTAPFDHARSRMRIQDVDPKVIGGEPSRYRGLIDCLVCVYQQEGLLAFYFDHIPKCLHALLTQIPNLAMKDMFKKMFPKYNPKTEFFQFFCANLCSGSLAAFCSLAIIYPFNSVLTFRLLEVYKRGTKEPKGYLDTAKEIVAKRGTKHLFTGIGVSLCGIVVYRGFQLGMFDTLTSLNPWKTSPGLLGSISKFLSAQIAIQVGAFISYPFDTIRRRLVYQHMVADEGEQLDESAVDCLKNIVNKEGVSGLYRGFGTNVLCSGLTTLTLLGLGHTRKSLGI